MSELSNEPRVFHWHQLTAPEVSGLAHDSVVVLPTGSTEQHGPHMVTGTDTILNDLLQRGLFETPPPEGKFLFLPTLILGSSEHHVPFGGTLTLPPILYTQVLVAMVRSLIKQGHRRIFLLNSHGGNQSPISTALAELAEECTEKEVLLGGASYWSFCRKAWEEELPDLTLGGSVGHACEIEASLLMVARPDLPLRSLPEGVPYPAFLKEGWSLAGNFPSMTKEGHIGYPEAATAERGERLFRVAVREVGAFLARFATRPLTHDLRSE